MFANNEIGTVQPIEQIGLIARKYNIIFHTDAVQAIGQFKIDVQRYNIDLLSISAHKFYGPKGVGALYVRQGVRIEKLIDGGTQEGDLRSGTENIPGKPSVLEQHTTVLGEVINAGEETIGEVYAKQNHTADVASRIVANNGVSLRKSIGINDKFLLARDLFGGDMAAYERMISELETYTDLNDALIYIHDHYNWNPNSDGVKFLMELLTRKLS